MRNALGLALLVLSLAACGDNLTPGGAAIDAPTVDAPIDAGIDAQVCSQRAAGAPGGACSVDADCDSTLGAADGFCLNNLPSVAPWPSQGYCINKLGTCTDDASCGAGNVCVTLDPGTPEEISACMAGCSADPCACPDGMICSNGYVGTDVGRMVCVPGDAGAIDGSPCTTFGDCDRQSSCLIDPFEAPGGQCISIGCTIGNDATCTAGGDGHCATNPQLGGGTACLDACVTDADCRAVDGFVCFDAGGATGKYCRHPVTGDACAADTDCGFASVWECRTGVTFPGGYCTIEAACDATTGAGCSLGSSLCHDPDGVGVLTPYCVDRCPTVNEQSTCRASYTCRDVNTGAGVTGGCVFP